MTLEIVFENRNQAIKISVEPTPSFIEYLKDDEYIEADLDVDELYDLYNDGYTDIYWDKVKKFFDGFECFLDDCIDKKEDAIEEAKANGNPYDYEWEDEVSNASDLTKYQWIADECIYRECIRITDVTNNPNPYGL